MNQQYQLGKTLEEFVGPRLSYLDTEQIDRMTGLELAREYYDACRAADTEVPTETWKNFEQWLGDRVTDFP